MIFLPCFMSLCNVIKEYKKLYRLFRRSGLTRETIIFSDSKGLGLKEVIPNCVSDKLNIVARKGATVYSEGHKDLFRKVMKGYNPIVLVWLGTCAISKKDKYIKLRSYPYQNIELVLTEYRELKNEILKVNKYAKVLFIECPYYSIATDNRLKRGANNSVLTTQSLKLID